MFSAMFLHQAETACNASAFTYEGSWKRPRFPAFGTTGSDEARRREVAAFSANVSHETTGVGPRRRTARSPGAASERNWPAEERSARAPRPIASLPRPTFPASAGKLPRSRTVAAGRGTTTTGAGEALGQPLLANPSLVAEDVMVGRQAALWFWMTTRSPNRPARRDDRSVGTSTEEAAGRYPGFGRPRHHQRPARMRGARTETTGWKTASASICATPICKALARRPPNLRHHGRILSTPFASNPRFLFGRR